MYKRTINISLSRSFFLFGARATGKTTLLRSLLEDSQGFFVDLLDTQKYSELQAYPQNLESIIRPAIDSKRIVVIDEIQRVPALLDIAHKLIQQENAKFALTGSSARKLKRNCANLLAGRASVYKLFPLLFSEIGEDFSLQHALEWGTLPELVSIKDDNDKLRMLQAYAETYIAEEIVAEQIIRKLPPFRRFLQVAAQMNGKVLNYSKIAADIQTDYSNVRNYFEILEDTLLGFNLECFHTSARKRLRQASKFYWIDTGVARSLQKILGIKLHPSTSLYGDTFEAFIVSQIRACLEYQVGQYQLSYLQTSKGAEIDLIIERAGEHTLCLEIKSGENVRKEDLAHLEKLSSDILNSIPVCLYRGTEIRQYGNVRLLPWKTFFSEFNLVAE